MANTFHPAAEAVSTESQLSSHLNEALSLTGPVIATLITLQNQLIEQLKDVEEKLEYYRDVQKAISELS